MFIKAYDVEIVRTAVAFAKVHVPFATSLLNAQQQAADMAGDIVFSEKDATYEPVNGWAPEDSPITAAYASEALRRSVFLLFEVPKDESSEDGDPVAVMVKIGLDRLARLDALGGAVLPLEECRWLKGIAFTDGVLSDVPGFFKSGQDTCVSIGDAFLIDEDQNNGVDFHGPQCECDPTERTTRIEAWSNQEGSFFVSGSDQGCVKLASFIFPLTVILNQVGKSVPMIGVEQFRQFSEQTLASTAALVALVNANELRPRANEQSLADWLHLCLVDEFALVNSAALDEPELTNEAPAAM